MTQAQVDAHQRKHGFIGNWPEAVPSDAYESESALHRDVLAYCRQQGWIVFHGSMAHRTARTVGEMDATICASNGRVFFVEMKARAGKLSTEQLGVKLWMERLGHTVHVVRSLEQFLEIVNR